MTKPTETARWGTDQTNELEPASGLKDTGHPLSSVLVSSYENWIKRIAYEWQAFLDSIFTDDGGVNNLNLDGSLVADSVQFNSLNVGSLVATTAAIGTVTGDLDVAGDVHYGAVRSKVLHPAMGCYTTAGSGYVLGFTNGDDATGLVPGGSGVWEATENSSSCRQHLCLESGSRVTQIKVRFEKSGVDASFNVSLYNAATGVHTLIEAFAPAQINGANNATLVLATPIVLGEGEDISISFVAPVLGDRLRMIQPYWSRP